MEEPGKPKRKPRRKPDDVTKFERLFADIRRAAFDKTLPEETSEDTAPRKPPKNGRRLLRNRGGPGRSLHHLMESVSGPASDGVAARKETAVR